MLPPLQCWAGSMCWQWEDGSTAEHAASATCFYAGAPAREGPTWQALTAGWLLQHADQRLGTLAVNVQERRARQDSVCCAFSLQQRVRFSLRYATLRLG